MSIVDKESDILLKGSTYYFQYILGAIQYTESIQYTLKVA